jgi:uncharacterized membrane protein
VASVIANLLLPTRLGLLWLIVTAFLAKVRALKMFMIVGRLLLGFFFAFGIFYLLHLVFLFENLFWNLLDQERRV